jgi:hypothetical protein
MYWWILCSYDLDFEVLTLYTCTYMYARIRSACRHVSFYSEVSEKSLRKNQCLDPSFLNFWRRLHSFKIIFTFLWRQGPYRTFFSVKKKRSVLWKGYSFTDFIFIYFYIIFYIYFGRPDGKKPLGRPRLGWEDNIKVDLREIGIDGANWIQLAQDRVQWRAFVNTVMNLRVP